VTLNRAKTAPESHRQVIAVTAFPAGRKHNIRERGETAVLMVGMLVLAFVGLDGILLIIATVLEHGTPEFGVKARASRPKTSRIVPPSIRNFARPRFDKATAQNPSAKEKLHEHACTG
jgi:hypothetical protein